MKDKKYFIDKINDIYNGNYIPELNYAVTGWDFAPEYILKYYNILNKDEKQLFRDTIKELFINGGQEWRYCLLYVCEKLNIKEAIPSMIEYGERYIQNNIKFDDKKMEPFQIPPRVLLNFIKKIGSNDPQAIKFIKQAEASNNYK